MKSEKINIAIVGFGNIGSYFYKILEKNKKKFLSKPAKFLISNIFLLKAEIKKGVLKFQNLSGSRIHCF